jgi:hypothetical protein
MTWRGRITREILTGAGYGALADSIIDAVDATWPEGAQPAPTPTHHDAATSPAKAPAEPAEYLTFKQLVVYSTLSERTLRGYIHRKVRPLPSYRVDKKILIRRVEFDGWLASFRRAEPVDEIAQAVDEMLSGLTGPRPPTDTRRHHMRRR